MSSRMKLLLLLLTLCSTTQSQNVLPNVGYLLRGYHLYHGNPLATQVTSDPGFRNIIFEPTYSRNLTSGDLRYILPDGTKAYAKSGCTQAFSHETVQGSDEYQRLLKDMIKTNYTGFENSFHGSTDYKHVDSTHSKDQSKELLITQILCAKYETTLDTRDPPGYSSEFRAKLIEIYSAHQNNDFDHRDSLIHDFLNMFGTHYVRKIELGSRLNFQSSLNALDRYNLEQAGIDPRSGAMYSMTKKMGHQLTEEELRKSHLFDKLVTGTKSSSSASYTGHGTLDVLNSVPIPLFYEIDRIDNIFVKGMASSLNLNYKQIKLLLGAYFDSYCVNENRFSGQDRCTETDTVDRTSDTALSSRNFKLVFPEFSEGESNMNSALWRSRLPEMTAFTVSWWMKTTPYTENSKKRRHILSYNCNQEDHFKILASAETQGGCLTILLDGEPLVGGSSCLIPFDGNYHHYVVTWSSTYGRWQMYIDGNIMDGGSSNRGFIIPSGGYLVLGQQHETGNIIQNPLTAFRGEIAFMNIWDFSVNGVEARNLARVNGELEGNVVQWDQSKMKFTGEELDTRAVLSNDEFFKI